MCHKENLQRILNMLSPQFGANTTKKFTCSNFIVVKKESDSKMKRKILGIMKFSRTK